MDRPLEGLRVIDLGQIFAVPYCTLQLAYLGAEVIKIEPPGTGEHLRRPGASPGGVNYAFLMLNPNKKSVSLNLKDPRGRELLLKLLEGADVIAENYSAGVMESLGLGYDALRDRFPRLIYASVKGYGSDGPWARLGAMDSTLQAACGLISVTGQPDGPGTRTPATFIDMGTGSHLVSAILAALIQRGRTGRGQRVEVSMYDMCVPAMTGLIANELEGKSYGRLGNRHRNACPSNIYPASDGEILIFCLTEAHWRTLARLMRRGDLISLPGYKDHASRYAIADEVDEIVSAWTRPIRRDDIVELLIEQGIPCAPVRSVGEVTADPELVRRRMLIDSEFSTRGKIKVMGTPLKLSAADDPARPVAPPPMLGEHTAQVLAAIGIDAAELDSLHNEGVV
ncbi:MAG: CoA transferase [Candidatus Binataceae bacterium]|nr:CoA transferase [Candidatus Binataceae bacterium]